MPFSCTKLGMTLLVLALMAGLAEGVQQAWAGQEVRACEILDLQGASRVIGPGAEHPGGDAERDMCLYSSPGVAMLTIQVWPAEYYDRVTILQPHTAAKIGDKARYNVQKTGVVAVQLVKGSHSVTLNVQPMGKPKTDYLEPLLSAAREVAARLQ
ncbi:MAG: hypothetical protein OEU68_03320 [Nitrospira sp.]|nr:hypothetical protein [Nitrospira sp.]MDH5316811.1 hypothetical protein [Nitrospira sp.]